jgi:hypothetical protein
MISFKEFCNQIITESNSKFPTPPGFKKMVITVSRIKPDRDIFVAKYNNVESNPRRTLVECLVSLVENYGIKKLGISVENTHTLQPYRAVFDDWYKAKEKNPKMPPVAGRGKTETEAAGKLLYNMFEFTKAVEIKMPKVMPIEIIKH